MNIYDLNFFIKVAYFLIFVGILASLLCISFISSELMKDNRILNKLNLTPYIASSLLFIFLFSQACKITPKIHNSVIVTESVSFGKIKSYDPKILNFYNYDYPLIDKNFNKINLPSYIDVNYKYRNQIITYRIKPKQYSEELFNPDNKLTFHIDGYNSLFKIQYKESFQKQQKNIILGSKADINYNFINFNKEWADKLLKKYL